MYHEKPDYYIYCADVYCEACTENIKARLAKTGDVPANPDDEHTFDSGEYPKGPFSDEESDSPQHCGSGENCLDPFILNGDKSGKFFENPLTSAGERYVREMHADGPTDITTFWMEFYELKEEPGDCPTCGDELDKDCQGELRCPTCDGPCPSCSDS